MRNLLALALALLALSPATLARRAAMPRQDDFPAPNDNRSGKRRASKRSAGHRPDHTKARRARRPINTNNSGGPRRNDNNDNDR